MGVRSKIFTDFGLICGPHFKSFLGFDGLNSMFVLSLFPSDFLHRFSNGIIDSWSSQNKVFVRKVIIAKTMFSQRSFFGGSRPDFWCFLEALGVFFSDFFCLGNRLEN